MASNRKFIFADGKIYHIYNRGTDRRNIFTCVPEYRRFFQLLSYYRFGDLPARFSHTARRDKVLRASTLHSLKRNQTLVDILGWCLMPNHYHLILRQTMPDGIRRFIGNVGNGYTRYFNIRNRRTGHLFQSTFRAVLLETDEQLLHLSRHIHLNPVVSSLVTIDRLPSYHWSSYPEYADAVPGFTEKQTVLGYFPSEFEYRIFVRDQSEYAAELAKVKHLTLEA